VGKTGTTPSHWRFLIRSQPVQCQALATRLFPVLCVAKGMTRDHAGIDSSRPWVRPHIQLRGSSLFFLISERPLDTLSPQQASLFAAIDGRHTVSNLESTYPGARDQILRWHDAGISELVRPLTPPANPHILVIEPHMDDAVLSAGGRLLRRRGNCRFTILSVVGRTNFTSYSLRARDFQDLEEVTRLRQQESLLVSALVGAEFRTLGWPDGPLRFWPETPWSKAVMERFRAAPETFLNLFPAPSEVEQLASQLLAEITSLAPSELWIPMGLGDHVDHRLTRSACLRMLAANREQFSQVRVSMYEDVPYSTAVDQAAKICAELTKLGMRMVRQTEDITAVFDEKLRLSSVYASQFKLSYIEPALRRIGARESGSPEKTRRGLSFHRRSIRPSPGNASGPRLGWLSSSWLQIEFLGAQAQPMSPAQRDRSSLRPIGPLGARPGFSGSGFSPGAYRGYRGWQCSVAGRQ